MSYMHLHRGVNDLSMLGAFLLMVHEVTSNEEKVLHPIQCAFYSLLRIVVKVSELDTQRFECLAIVLGRRRHSVEL